ncbi:MAG: slipin family protein [Candidatus Njordarchaeia archaeon]
MTNGTSARGSLVAFIWFFLAIFGIMAAMQGGMTAIFTLIIIIIIGALVYIFAGLYIIKEWERLPILRLGKFVGIRGPGVKIVFPVIESVPRRISLRIMPYKFVAEQTMTRDNIPVSVDAVVYYRVIDPEKAILNVEDFEVATQLASQTSLREVIGMVELDELLAHREKIAAHLQEIIDEKTESWGVKVTSVEIRDIQIPQQLQDAIAMQAQAERERRARVTLAQAEVEASRKMLEAARTYKSSPLAFELRWLNILYEIGRQNNTLMLIPARFPIVLEPGQKMMEILGFPPKFDMFGETEKEEKKEKKE